MAATDRITEAALQAFTIRTSTELKAIRTLLNGNAPNNDALTTTAKGNLVAALNELDGIIDTLSAGGGVADADDVSFAPGASGLVATDVQAAVLEVFAAIDARLTALIGSAPANMDTLQELAALLADAGDDITALVTGLASRVRFDVDNQGLSPTEQANAQANIGVTASEVDYVELFESGLV